MLVCEQSRLDLQQMRLFAEELFGFSSNCGILSGCDGRDRRGKGIRTGECLRSLYFRFLVLVSEDSANETFCHTDPLLYFFLYSSRRASGTNTREGCLCYRGTAALGHPFKVCHFLVGLRGVVLVLPKFLEVLTRRQQFVQRASRHHPPAVEHVDHVEQSQ